MKDAQPRWMRTALAGTAILSVMAVLTFWASEDGAKKILGAAEPFMLRAAALFRQSYHAAPALTVGIILAACLPLVAALIRMSKPLTRSKNATRPYKPRRGDTFDARLAGPPAIPRHLPFIEIENGRGMRCAILRDMLRIGREDDNDIRIPSRYVHRYHAAIHREDLDDWRITDLTGVESNGLIINGKRCCEARLNDGDLIQLGPGKLRFRAGIG
ncbi:MAG: FHA domain-containing protein [Hyphomicrobium sp.]|uniref:FHA domain-containing protein n=1 Tax=Hyphomicrobium sp. TaxID=82 RepID=UPI0039E343DF